MFSLKSKYWLFTWFIWSCVLINVFKVALVLLNVHIDDQVFGPRCKILSVPQKQF